MDDFPAQSHKSREPREVLPVTTEAGRVRKTPAGRRFRETFIQGDAQSVWSSMIWDAFLPGVRDNVANAIHEGIDALLGGMSGGARRTHSRYSSSRNGISVNRHSPDKVLTGRSERYDDDARRNQDVSVIEIDSRVEAEEVLSQMNLIIDQHDVCTLADFYQMVRITPQHTDYKFGWEELGNARVVHSKGSYYIDLPRPSQLR